MSSIKYSKEASVMLGGDHWFLMEPIRRVIMIPRLNRNAWVSIPKFYLTDGATVPRPMWSLIPPWGDHGEAAIIHDYLCDYLTVQTQNGPMDITRKEADRVFYDVMRDTGVGGIKARTMYAAVAAYRKSAPIHREPVSEKSYDVAKAELEAKARLRGGPLP